MRLKYKFSIKLALIYQNSTPVLRLSPERSLYKKFPLKIKNIIFLMVIFINLDYPTNEFLKL